jgi:predicted metalloendopeptidase
MALSNEEDRTIVDRNPEKAYNDIIKYAQSQRRGVCGTGVVTKKSVNPSNDFFSYVNQAWIRSKRLKREQQYIVQIDNFRLAQDAIYNQLVDIVDSADTPRAVKHLYASLKTPLSSSVVVGHVRDHVRFLDECIAEDNLWKLLAYLNTNEMTQYACPVSWDVSADEKNSKTGIAHLTYPELSLYDYRYYLRDPVRQTNTKSNRGAINKTRHNNGNIAAKSTKSATRKTRRHRESGSGKDREYKREVLNKFVAYVNKIGKTLGVSISGTDVLRVEKTIIANMACYTGAERRASSTNSDNDGNDYEKVTARALKTETQFDWPEFARNLGYANPSPGPDDRVVCSSTGYLKCTMRSLLGKRGMSAKSQVIDSDPDTDTADDDDDADADDYHDAKTPRAFKFGWKSAKWRSYWIYIYARHIIQYHADWSDIHYAFCMKFLRGQAAPLPQRIVALYGTTYAYDAFFAREYSRRYFNAAQVDYAKEVARDIRHAAKEMVRANTWVSKSTRAEALRKIDALKVTIGDLPERLGPDVPAQISARFHGQDGWSNLMDIFRWKTRVMVRNDGRPEYDAPQIDWNQMKFVGSQAYVANAYYTETRNSIYVPLGYFQTGFVDLSHGPEYNLARIGYTLGHELGHSLHVYGRMFDHTGNMRSWWTRRDATIYNRKLANVERQYEAAARRDGLDFDAKLSLSEDLADITGLKLCEMVLNARHQRDKMLVPLRLLSFEKFYTEFANQNRQKIYRRSIFAQLKSNPHPLDKYRTNVPLSRMALFNKIYNIKPGDQMHWQTEDTVW